MKKWRLPIVTGLGVFAIMLLVWRVFCEYRNFAFQKSAPPAVYQITPIHSSSSVSIHSPSSSSTPLQDLLSKPPQGWKTLVSDKYKFQFFYPASSFYSGFSVPVCNTAPTFFPMRLRCVANLYYIRGGGEDQQFETISISAAEKDSTSSLIQWATTPNPDLHLHDIPSGNIADVLARAHAEQEKLIQDIRNPEYIRPPDKFVTHNERTEKGVEILELGAVLDSGGRFSYTTLLTKSRLKYIYSVELFMQPSKLATKPSDQELIEMYKHLISSIVFTE